MDNDFPKTFEFCNEGSFNEFTYKKSQDLSLEISQEDPDDISSVDESEYLKYLLETYLIKTLSLKFDKTSTWETARLIPAEWFQQGQFWVEKGQKYERGVIIYRIPFEGDGELFKLKPNENIISYGGEYANTYIENGNLCFELINFNNDLQKIRVLAEKKFRFIEEKYSQLTQKINDFNYSLERQAKNAIEQRKRRIVDLSEILGVPVKKILNVPEVFSTGEGKEQLVIIKPSLHEKNHISEYVLGDEIYFDILQKIHDIGKNFERYPSTHEGKEEEDLRDFIITFLQPLYKLAVTGETFNKKGKTDILMRYQNTNVFIAECKFWRGKKEFLKGITQLLGYLTWRDSKAAVIVFVKRKGFSSILQNVKSCISEHDNYLNYVDEREETWLNYTFHLNEDKEREVKLSVQLFNLAESN